jgi:hypothetical protein
MSTNQLGIRLWGGGGEGGFPVASPKGVLRE